MHPKLKINLENKTSYINTWNFFSKSLIIKENLEKHWKIALVIDSEKSLNQYKKVFEYLKINYEEINNYSSLCNLAYNSVKSVFLVLNYKLKEEIVKESQLLHFSQIIEKWTSQEINNIVKKLSELWYEFSDYFNNWTYKKIWDILSITDFSWNIEYKISFWWENIEEIIEIKKSPIIPFQKGDEHNNFNALEKIVIWWKNNIFNDDVKKEWNLQNYLINSWIFTILDSLDFSEFYEENTKILKNFCSFDFVWNKILKIKDLEIKSPVIENIDALKKILNSDNNIFIYTKNKKTIDNFIDYNELNKDAVIKEISWNYLKSFEFKKEWKIICDDILCKIFIKNL